MTDVRIAAAAWPLDELADFSAYEAKLSAWVSEAAAHGAELLVFPEYGAMELGSLGGREVSADLEACLHEVARWKPQVDALHIRLAAKFGLHILGASGPVFIEGQERPVNRATLYGPAGILGHQDKQIMTRFEREIWFVDPGQGLRVFDTPLGRLGVAICYDSEFPLLSRALVEAGAEFYWCHPAPTPSAALRASGWGPWRARLKINALWFIRPPLAFVISAPPSMRMWALRRSMALLIWAFPRTAFLPSQP